MFSSAEMAAGGRWAEARESWLVLRAACAMENTTRRVGGTIRASFLIQSSRKRWQTRYCTGRKKLEGRMQKQQFHQTPHYFFILTSYFCIRLSATCGLVSGPSSSPEIGDLFAGMKDRLRTRFCHGSSLAS